MRSFWSVLALGLWLAWMGGASAQTSADTQLRINATLQDALGWTGHYDGLSDGTIGAKTLTAIAAFQRERGFAAAFAGRTTGPTARPFGGLENEGLVGFDDA